MSKTTRPIVRIHDLSIDTVIDREMTDAEFAKYEADQAEEKAKANQVEAKEAAKSVAQAKLAALGLTVEDLQALGL